MYFLESINIAEYFSYLLAAKDTLVVGDMPFDILMGKNAGVYTCEVTYGISDKNSL